MGNFGQSAKGGPFALWPKSPILSTLQKIGHFSANSCCFIEILVSVETRINFASIHTNQAKIRLVLTDFIAFQSVAKKMANFQIFAKGPPFALWPKSPILSTLQKICHFSANSCCFIEILVSVETRINFASIHD